MCFFVVFVLFLKKYLRPEYILTFRTVLYKVMIKYVHNYILIFISLSE